MANGLLGKGVTAVNTPLTPYVVPSDLSFATVSVLLLNTSSEDATVSVSLSTSAGTPSIGDRVAHNVVIPANGGTFELGCQILSPGERVVVQSNKSSVVVRVSGMEQPVVQQA